MCNCTEFARCLYVALCFIATKNTEQCVLTVFLCSIDMKKKDTVCAQWNSHIEHTMSSLHCAQGTGLIVPLEIVPYGVAQVASLYG